MPIFHRFLFTMTVSTRKNKQVLSHTPRNSNSNKKVRTEGPKKTRKICEPVILTPSQWARAGQSRLTRKSREHQQRCCKGTLCIPPHSDHNCPHQTENFYRLIQSRLQQQGMSEDNEELELSSNSNDHNDGDDVQCENANLANSINWILDAEYLKGSRLLEEIMDVDEPESESGQQETDSHLEDNLVMNKRPDSPPPSEPLPNQSLVKPNSAPDLTDEMIATIEAAVHE
ncbi:unnamed protein product [Orchesella dallaii]|uniref:Uncharacterized protein n=1 Tax=Orchesella dallaii TaxID=48710 RepID=A0ABP1S6G2_9HEXA